MTKWKSSKKNFRKAGSVQRSSRELCAAAISIDKDLPIPELAAVGKGELAREIKKIAIRYGIPIKRSNALAQKLSSLEDGEEIAHEDYYQIAKIISEI